MTEVLMWVMIVARAVWDALWEWSHRPPRCEPYAMCFDELSWKIRLEFGSPSGDWGPAPEPIKVASEADFRRAYA